MPSTSFNPARLTLARRRRSLTKVALAREVGLTPRRIAALENEGAVPSDETVHALSRTLRFPPDFFARPGPAEPSDDAVSFRSFSRLPARQRDAALASAALAVDVASWFSERFDLPAAAVPDLQGVDPTTAATVVRTEWGLGADPAPNMVHLLEAHGVYVFSIVEACKELDAFSMWHGNRPLVFLTNHKSPERGRWDAAHELAHLALHGESSPRGREQEREADEFASEFLLPERGIRPTAPRYPSLADVEREKLYWRTSAMAYIRCLHSLDLVSDWHYRSLAIEASQAGYRRAEADIEREESQLIPKMLEMLADDGTTLTEIALDLALDVTEFRDLLFSVWAGHEGSGGVASRRPTQPSESARHLRALP